jgi:hypothetical protein
MPIWHHRIAAPTQAVRSSGISSSRCWIWSAFSCTRKEQELVAKFVATFLEQQKKAS